MPPKPVAGPFERFTKEFPKAHAAYERLGEACHTSGPLDAKTRELIKLGMSIAARSEGAVHSHVRKALHAGASQKEIKHAVCLAIPTLGLPTTVAAFTWVSDILDSKSRSRPRRIGRAR
jgi:AhpD family alkylhydroperoxidase